VLANNASVKSVHHITEHTVTKSCLFGVLTSPFVWIETSLAWLLNKLVWTWFRSDLLFSTHRIDMSLFPYASFAQIVTWSANFVILRAAECRLYWLGAQFRFVPPFLQFSLVVFLVLFALINPLTSSLLVNPSCQSNSMSDTPAAPLLLYNLKFRYPVHNSMPPVRQIRRFRPTSYHLLYLRTISISSSHPRLELSIPCMVFWSRCMNISFVLDAMLTSAYLIWKS